MANVPSCNSEFSVNRSKVSGIRSRPETPSLILPLALPCVILSAGTEEKCRLVEQLVMKSIVALILFAFIWDDGASATKRDGIPCWLRGYAVLSHEQQQCFSDDASRDASDGDPSGENPATGIVPEYTHVDDDYGSGSDDSSFDYPKMCSKKICIDAMITITSACRVSMYLVCHHASRYYSYVYCSS